MKLFLPVINRGIIILIIQSISWLSFSQGIPKQPLDEILKSAEQEFGWTFSYKNDLIEGVYIIPPAKGLTRGEVLQYLSNSTGLLFTQINERYIAISKKETNKQVCGYLIDRLTKEPISEAFLLFSSGNAISDSEGFFNFPVNTDDTIFYIQHWGYRNKIVLIEPEPTPGSCDKVMLDPKITTLEDVIIQSVITDGISQLAGGKIRIDNQKLNILPGLSEPDVLHAAAVMPGISNLEERISLINIRGGSSDQSLILLDGVKVYMPGHFFGLISAINPFIIGTSDIIKNGTPAKYTDGISGTILIETEDEIPQKWGVNSSVNLLNASVQVYTPLWKKSGLQLTFRNSYASALTTPTFQSYFKQAFQRSPEFQFIQNIGLIGAQNNFVFRDWNIKFNQRFSNNDQIEVGVFNFSNLLEFEERGWVVDRIVSRISSLQQNNYISHAKYTRHWSPRLKSEVMTYMSRYNLASVNYNVSNSVRSEQGEAVNDYGTRLHLSAFLNAKWGLETGLQFDHLSVTEERLINNPALNLLSREVLESFSQFFSLDFLSLDHKLEWVLGNRINYYDKFERFTFEPRTYLVYHVSDELLFEVQAERKNQTQTQIINNQDDFLSIENRKWVLMNELDIPLIVGDQFSGGVNVKGTHVLTTLTGFYKRVDGISTASQGINNSYILKRSSGSYTSKGIELLVNPKFKNISTWISYTLLDTDYLFSQISNQEFRSSFDITHNASWGLQWNYKDVEVATSFQFMSGRPYTQITQQTGEEAIIGPINGDELGNYLRWDASLKYKYSFNNGTRANISASFWNISNRVNEVNVRYRQNTDGTLQTSIERGLGFTPNVQVQFQF